MSEKKRGSMIPSGKGFLRWCWGLRPNCENDQISCSTFASRSDAVPFFVTIFTRMMRVVKRKAIARWARFPCRREEKAATRVKISIAASICRVSFILFVRGMFYKKVVIVLTSLGVYVTLAQSINSAFFIQGDVTY